MSEIDNKISNSSESNFKKENKNKKDTCVVNHMAVKVVFHFPTIKHARISNIFFDFGNVQMTPPNTQCFSLRFVI